MRLEIAQKDFSARDLRTMLNGLNRSDNERLYLRVWQSVLDAEGRLTNEQQYLIVEEMFAKFREGISNVDGFKEATSEAYITENPNKIKLKDTEGTEWNITYRGYSQTYYDSEELKSHDEALAIFTKEGVGLEIKRDWWTGDEDKNSKHAYLYYTSDPRLANDSSPTGYHPGTQLGANMAKETLTKLLANTVK